MHPESNKRISPWVCSGPDGRACRLLYLVTSTQTDTEHLYLHQLKLKPPQNRSIEKKKSTLKLNTNALFKKIMGLHAFYLFILFGWNHFCTGAALQPF